MKIQGTWIISLRSIGVPRYQTRCKWARTANPTQYNKKISKKKKVGDYGKSIFSTEIPVKNGIRNRYEIFNGTPMENIWLKIPTGNIWAVIPTCMKNIWLTIPTGNFDCKPPLRNAVVISRVFYLVFFGLKTNQLAARVDRCQQRLRAYTSSYVL